MNKFRTPVAMIVTEEQFEKDLKEPLRKLGYEGDILEYKYASDFITYNYLTNYYNNTFVKPEIGMIDEYLYGSELKNTYVIDHYNPSLYLALASMTETDIPIIGEYMISLKSSTYYGNNYQKNEIFPLIARNTGPKSYCNKGQFGSGYCRKTFRKCTKEELISFFIKKNNEMPEKWVLKITIENKDFCKNLKNEELHFPENYDYTIGGYYTNVGETTYGFSTIPSDYVEITLEQFKKYVVTKKDIQKLNNMEKEIIGYKLKDNLYNEYNSRNSFLKAVARLGLIHHQTENPNEEQILKDVFRNEIVRSHYEKAGVLDLWFEPIYKEKFKVGDWVYVEGNTEKNYVGNGITDSCISQLYSLDSAHLNPTGHTRDNAHFIVKQNNNYYCTNKKHILRLATQEEIDLASIQIVKIGNFNVTIKGKQIYHGTDNITSFVKEVYNFWKTTLNQGKLFFSNYDFTISNIVLSKTGCQNNVTYLQEWLKIYDLIK